MGKLLALPTAVDSIAVDSASASFQTVTESSERVERYDFLSLS
jgi:hypothetical protein